MNWYKEYAREWKEIIDSRFYESDYKNITQKLLYDEIDYDYAVQNGIALIAKSDVFLYKIIEKNIASRYFTDKAI